MLLFSSGTFTVDGITVFPDHADPNQFWYLPGPVGLESEADSTEPQFLLILYTPDVAAAGIKGTGFLNVTLAFKVSDMTQSKIIGQIRTQFPDVSNPRLSPVPFDEGTVQVVALDLQGSGGDAARARVRQSNTSWARAIQSSSATTMRCSLSLSAKRARRSSNKLFKMA